MTHVISIPAKTLLVLCGPSGCGKSTFAAHQFQPTQIVASDVCRALLYDSETYRSGTNRHVFDLFHFILQKRLLLGRLAVADSTALHAYARRDLLNLASDAQYHTCLIIFHVPLAICLQRNKLRRRQLPPDIIEQQYELLQEALQQAHRESWGQVHVLGEAEEDVRFMRQIRKKDVAEEKG